MYMFSLHAGILIMLQRATGKIDDVLTEHGGLPHVLPFLVGPILHG